MKSGFLSLAAMTALLTVPGCLPIPTVERRTYGVSGRVLDAATHQPIRGAEVALDGHPGLRSARTKADGSYALRPSYNFSPAMKLGMCGTPMNLFSTVETKLNVTREGYEAQSFDPLEKTLLEKGDNVVAHDVLLKPLRTSGGPSKSGALERRP